MDAFTCIWMYVCAQGYVLERSMRSRELQEGGSTSCYLTVGERLVVDLFHSTIIFCVILK